VMIGTTGSTLTGFGGNDTFVFNQTSGSQTIADFQPGQDKIELDNIFTSANDPAFTTFISNLHAAADSVHSIDLGGGNVITTTGVSVNTLHANDFLLH
jgi:Ca2+-binding RTX toxin-like protein